MRFTDIRAGRILRLLALLASASTAAAQSLHPIDPGLVMGCFSQRAGVADSVASFDLELDSVATPSEGWFDVYVVVQQPRAGISAPNLSYSFTPPGAARNTSSSCPWQDGATLRITASRSQGAEIRVHGEHPVRVAVRGMDGTLLDERWFFRTTPVPRRMHWARAADARPSSPPEAP